MHSSFNEDELKALQEQSSYKSDDDEVEFLG